MENTLDSIDSIVKRLDFVENVAARYKIAVALQGAENAEAGLITLRSAWNRKEAALRRQLEAERRGGAKRSHETTKESIMKIRDPDRRQSEIAKHLDLFGYSYL